MRRVSSPGVPGSCAGWRAGTAAGHDRGVLPVTPFTAWCLVPGVKSGAGGDLAGWVLSLRARRSDSVFPCAAPRAASFLPVHEQGRRGGDDRTEEEHEEGRRVRVAGRVV